MSQSNILQIGGFDIPPGKTLQIEMPVVRLYTDTDISMPVHVIRSKKPGPTVFVSAAVHGDELNGVEILRRLIKQKNFHETPSSPAAILPQESITLCVAKIFLYHTGTHLDTILKFSLLIEIFQ